MYQLWMKLILMIQMTKLYDYADDTDDDNDHNDSYTAAGAGPLVLAPWSWPFGPALNSSLGTKKQQH